MFFTERCQKICFINLSVSSSLYLLFHIPLPPPPGPVPTKLYFYIFILKYENFMFHVFVILMNVLQPSKTLAKACTISTNQRLVFGHMSFIWTNERTGFNGKFYPKAPPLLILYMIKFKVQLLEIQSSKLLKIMNYSYFSAEMYEK